LENKVKIIRFIPFIETFSHSFVLERERKRERERDREREKGRKREEKRERGIQK
jgi:hypothetical protein